MERQDIYSRVTDAIVAQLEAGTRPWVPSWTGGPMSAVPLRATGEAYRGVNVLLLWGAAMASGFRQPRWMTYRQAQDNGGQVRKGERGSCVVYAGRITRDGEPDADGEAGEVSIPFMRGYTVFNVEQIDGLGAEWFEAPAPERPEPARDARAEAFFAAQGATVGHGGGRAFFHRGEDRIQMPDRAAFADAEGYYATLAHEFTHWTGHASRLDRTFGKRFGDRAYAVEELVAELGAAYVCAHLGLSATPREDHAAYLAEWLHVLKADKRAIFTAASAAQAAADYLAKRAEPAAALAA